MVGGRHRGWHGTAAGLDRDNRFAACHPPGEAGELPGVTEALQIQQHHLGVRIAVPVLQQVITGHVSTVACRHKRRQTQLASGGSVQDRDAEGARLAEEADRTSPGNQRRQCGIETDSRIGVRHTEGVGPHQPHSVLTDRLDQTSLGFEPGIAGLAESGGQHEHRLDTLGQTVVENVLDRVGRNRDDGQVHRIRDVAHRRIGADAAHRPVLGIDRIHGPGEPRGDHVRQHRVADLQSVHGSADDRNRRRPQQICHTSGF